MVVAARVLVMALAFSLPSVSAAAQSGAAKGRKRTRTATAAKTAFVFSRDLDRLPPNYFGSEVRYYIARWLRAYRSRGEFESTAEYRAELETKLPIETLDFSLPPGDAIRYDADEGIVVASVSPTASLDSVYAPAGREGRSVPYKGWGISLSTELVKERTVTAQTVFGRRFRVQQELHYKAGVAFTSQQPSYVDSKLSLRVPMDRDEARRSKPNLRLLLVVRPDRSQIPDTVVFSESRRSEASLDSPYDIATNSFWLAVVLDEIWLYNSKTGEILVRAKVRGGAVLEQVEPLHPPVSPIVPGQSSGTDRALARARELVISGRDEEALIEIESVLAKNRGLAPAFTLRALVLERLGRLPEAVEAVRTAVALDPTEITPHLVDARLAVKQKDCAAAKRSIDAAAAIDSASEELEPLRELFEAACAPNEQPD